MLIKPLEYKKLHIFEMELSRSIYENSNKNSMYFVNNLLLLLQEQKPIYLSGMKPLSRRLLPVTLLTDIRTRNTQTPLSMHHTN
jgi:hypothetical protein